MLPRSVAGSSGGQSSALRIGARYPSGAFECYPRYSVGMQRGSRVLSWRLLDTRREQSNAVVDTSWVWRRALDCSSRHLGGGSESTRLLLEAPRSLGGGQSKARRRTSKVARRALGSGFGTGEVAEVHSRSSRRARRRAISASAASARACWASARARSTAALACWASMAVGCPRHLVIGSRPD